MQASAAEGVAVHRRERQAWRKPGTPRRSPRARSARLGENARGEELRRYPGRSPTARRCRRADDPDLAGRVRAGDVHGPGSPEFAVACRRSLDELWDAREALRAATVLITADHGQVAVGPDRVDYLDDLWPELPSLLSQQRPAGSSRDVFLHVHAEHVPTVIDELSARLGGRAEVRRAGELFEWIGPRLKSRLGDVAVLPADSRQAWLRSAAANEQRFRGQHGGLHEAETSTYLARMTN
jgi:Type I phosphodiesterase / nucleotide pyrophosphatase